jgi:hypothetical protein
LQRQVTFDVHEVEDDFHRNSRYGNGDPCFRASKPESATFRERPFLVGLIFSSLERGPLYSAMTARLCGKWFFEVVPLISNVHSLFADTLMEKVPDAHKGE